MAQRLDEVLMRVNRYRELQSLFLRLCEEITKQFLTGNGYGIEIQHGSDPTRRDLSVLDVACRMRFGVLVLGQHDMVGKLTLERVLPKDEARELFTVYYDRHGNASDAPDDTARHFDMSRPTFDSWFAIRVLEAFFADSTRKGASTK